MVGAVLGTMTFGSSVDAGEVKGIVAAFAAAGGRELDTAYLYGKGAAEEILGGILRGNRESGASAKQRAGKRSTPGKADSQELAVSTKAHPHATGDLSPASVRAQLERSLERLGMQTVEIFYLHQPDPTTALELTLSACQELYEEGKFRKLGLSNYPAWQVAGAWHTCHARGWVLPTVYQGMYNALTREVERELLPCLRQHSVRFYAYNPLAGGLLTGRYDSADQLPVTGRFSERPSYRKRYWNPLFFQALAELRPVCNSAGIPMNEAALRWLLHHSRLQAQSGDAVVLGVSSLEHLRADIPAWRAGPLPQAVTAAFEAAWEISRPVCPSYFRP